MMHRKSLCLLYNDQWNHVTDAICGRFRLVDTLEAVLDRYGASDDLELLQLGKFPQSIKLDQAVEAWKHIVHYYAQRH